MTLKVAICGIDGTGKTSALKYLVEQARHANLKVIETREVGNPHVPVCQKLREIVLNPDSSLRGDSMEFIFAAMRLENDEWFRKLKYSNDAPDLVLSDREWWSHLAYTDHNVSKDFTEKFYDGMIRDMTSLPDVTIYLQVDSETALKRRVRRGEAMDAIEMKGIEFQEKVAKSFLYYLDKYQREGRVRNIFYVDANKTLPEVQMQLDRVLDTIILSLR